MTHSMQAIQFETTLTNDGIQVPSRYRDWTGRNVKVILLSDDDTEQRPSSSSALDIIAQTPGHRLFQTADDVDRHLRSERDQWDA